MKKIRYIGEAVLLYALFGFFRLLPPGAASACGGWIGRTVGPRLAASRKAYKNLRLALPELPAGRHREIVRGMWDNLGRIMAEYPHLQAISRDRVEIVNPPALGKPAIIMGGHLGNWELLLQAPYVQNGVAFDAVYRAPNNPWADRFLKRIRTSGGAFKTIPKTRGSARLFVESLDAGRPVLLLIDQKYNEGIAAPFFGHDAKTSTAFVKIPQRYGCPLIPVRSERLGGARFRVHFLDPLPVTDAGGNPRPIEDVVRDAHGLLENWIREKPEQWLWLHRRWPREAEAHSS